MYNPLVVALLYSSPEMNGGTPMRLVNAEDMPSCPSGSSNSRYTMINTPVGCASLRIVHPTWRSTRRNDVESPSWWWSASTNNVVSSTTMATTATEAKISKVRSASGFSSTFRIWSYATLPRPVSTRTREYSMRSRGTASRTRNSCMTTAVST